MAKIVQDATRANLYVMEPDKLTIISDPAHPLYDERINLPLDEQLVKNIMVYGVKVPILVRKDGDVMQVVDGRQRVRAAIEANKRLEKEGGLAVKVRVVLEKGDDAEMVGVGILTNELRQGDSVLTKARKAKRMLDLDPDADKCALVFGVTKVQLNRWLKLLDLDPKVQEAIEKQEIPAMAAVALAELPREKQLEELKTLKEESATTGKKVTVSKTKRAAKKAAGGDAKHERPSLRQLQRIFASKLLDDDDTTLIGWVIGEVSSKDAGIDDVMADIEKQDADAEAQAAEQKKAEREASRAEKKEAAEAKKREKAEAKAAKKAEREAKKQAKADAAKAKKEARDQKLAEKKAKAEEAKAAKKAEKERKKQEAIDRKAALKKAMEDAKAEVLKKHAAKSAKR